VPVRKAELGEKIVSISLVSLLGKVGESHQTFSVELDGMTIRVSDGDLTLGGKTYLVEAMEHIVAAAEKTVHVYLAEDTASGDVDLLIDEVAPGGFCADFQAMASYKILMNLASIQVTADTTDLNEASGQVISIVPTEDSLERRLGNG
jgi:hypothetical protein